MAEQNITNDDEYDMDIEFEINDYFTDAEDVVEHEDTDPDSESNKENEEGSANLFVSKHGYK
jgi:hypothetical protein